MNIENLAQLTFEQLNEIQQCVSAAISEKMSMRINDAASDLLDFLASSYPDVSLADVINELVFRSQISFDGGPSTILSAVPNPNSDVSAKTVGKSERVYQSAEMLTERLKTIRNSVLQHDDSRLLWLTNDGTQKTSKMVGKELAEILQEAIKRLERLESMDEVTDKIEDLSLEISKVEEWAEFKLGISLFNGTLTVINPFSARHTHIKANPRSSQRSPATVNPKPAENKELNFPLQSRRGSNNYASL
jgi:hypothetical protein